MPAGATNYFRVETDPLIPPANPGAKVPPEPPFFLCPKACFKAASRAKSESPKARRGWEIPQSFSAGNLDKLCTAL